MTNTTKVYNLIKKGFKNPKRKVGVNYWRFIFNAVGENTGAEKSFFIELEYINPSLSPSAPRLGFKPRVKISEADLQYVLAGTNSAKTLEQLRNIAYSYKRNMKGGGTRREAARHAPMLSAEPLNTTDRWVCTVGSLYLSAPAFAREGG